MRFFEKVPVKVEGMVQGSSEYVLIEIKSLFSIILTHLASNGSTIPHSHAFNAVTVWLYGQAREIVYGDFKNKHRELSPGKIKFTPRSDFHAIFSSVTGAWFLTFRGPWKDTWQELRNEKLITLTHGRKEIE